MTFNDLTLVLSALVSAGLVVMTFRLDRDRLYSVIVIFLILNVLIGSKTAILFGHMGNIGSVIYAAVFLATYFIIERNGHIQAIRSVVTGIFAIIFFGVLLQLAVLLQGTPGTESLNTALSTAFQPASRGTFALLLAYLFSQTFNLILYFELRRRFEHRHLWLRANIANACAQAIAGFVFFTVAFWNTPLPAHLLEIMLTGYVIKVVFMMLAAPLLYLNRVEEDYDKSYATLVLR
ncbi:MAG: queuosine precursor transporter [Bacillota bacterium]